MTWPYHKIQQPLISNSVLDTAFDVRLFIRLTNAVPGQSLPAFDTTLFIGSAVIVTMAAVILVMVAKGWLG
jgi:hypothetical protein